MSQNKALVTDIPYALGFGVPEALVRYDRGEFAADYAIGNMPWLSAANAQNQISRVTTTYQKERIDQGSSAGENSLSNWWLRSATSWHRGAGLTFYDASSDDIYRFADSKNIDVWTPGELRLLKDTDAHTLANAHHPATTSAGTWMISGGHVYLVDSSSVAHQVTALTATAQVLTSDGSYALVGANDGIYQIASDLSVTMLYGPPSGSTTWIVNSIAFVKDRIVVGAQITHANPMHIFELGRNPSVTPTAIVIADHSRYETKGVTFPTITATTSAILVGSTIGIVSQVLSFTIDTTVGGIGEMQYPIIVAEFPRGETLNQLRSYLNTYVVAATSRGIRIGVENSAGNGFTYGQLLVDSPVVDLAFNGEYVYATRADATSDLQMGLWRINLGEEVGTALAYASDISTGASTVTGVAFLGDTNRLVVTNGVGYEVESATRYAADGYIRSGWIRYGTTERKQPVSIMIRTSDTTGTVGFSVEDAGSHLATFDSLPLGTAINVSLSSVLLADNQHQVTISMARDADDSTISPVLEEWQFRSLPAPIRSRTITLPLRCFGEEDDANGVRQTSDPWERFARLEALEQSGSAVLFQDFSTGEERICQIKGVQFEQSSPPSFVGGFGGIVTVQLQTIDVEVM